MLGAPWVYRLFVRLVVGDQPGLQDLARQVPPGSRVLDLGCGPAQILDRLPEVDYFGIDLSEKYIREAQERYGDRGSFRQQDLAGAVIDQPASYDVVLALGVLHHLSDDQARHTLDLVRQALKPGGKLLTSDGCFVAGQSPIARWLLKMDRGDFVRTEAEYRALVSGLFGKVTAQVREDVLRIRTPT